jgi:hypothetical protein
MGALINLKNKRFGRLKVISRLKNDDNKQPVWRCKCDCGNTTDVICRSLVHNRTKSCGCLHREKVRKRPYYHLFAAIKGVCKRSKKQCKLTFNDFLKFVKIKRCHYCNESVIWNKHNGHDCGHYNLDRKDNTLGYTKENCVVCCPMCNQMKRSIDYKIFYNFTKPIRLFKQSNSCDCKNHENQCCDICTGWNKNVKDKLIK